MNEEKIANDEAAKALLMLNDSRYAMIKSIRHGGNERTVAMVFVVVIVIAELLLHKTSGLGSGLGTGTVAISIAMLLWGQQIWNEKRFNALLDFLEKENIIRK